jgi:putative ABC transport system ATP-binding protein
MPVETVLKFENVTKIYASAPELPALTDLSFVVRRGEFTAIVGPSGSGKSTILNLAAALDEATSGEIECGGRNITRLGRAPAARLRRQSLGFVFQAYNLFPTLTALENVEYTSLIRGDAAADTRRRGREALRDVGLGGLESRFPSQLSGGQQQRVAVARALVSAPALILADEPTANLDSQTAMNLIDLFNELNRDRGVTFLFSSHDGRLVSRARRRLTLRDGTIVDDDAEIAN